MQDRFQELIKNRLRAEFESRPPLFPWEANLAEYPVELPADSQAASRLWLDNLRRLRVANALPEAMLAQLLERCQALTQLSMQQGVRLIKTVEGLFPDETERLEHVAGIVLTPAYRSGTDSRAAAVQELETLASSYDAATPEQQIAISMLAAQEIMAALTLTLSEREPQLTREWLTAQGLLKLDLKYEYDLLFVKGSCPTNTQISLYDSDVNLHATRTQPGQLELVKASPRLGHTYTLEIALPDTGQRPLRFALSIAEDAE